MKALKQKVIIKPDDFEQKETASGLIVDLTDKEKMQQTKGIVVAIGEQVTDINVGDHIIYSPLTFDEISDEGETYHVVEIDDVFAIIT